MRDQARWEWLEEWLVEHEDDTFSIQQLAASMKLSTTTATLLVQGYLAAQRTPNSSTLYVLKRQGRTRAAVWSVGKRVLDARALDLELLEDLLVKIDRTWKPDTRRLAELNPALAKRYERKVEQMMGGALVVLRGVLDDALGE